MRAWQSGKICFPPPVDNPCEGCMFGTVAHVYVPSFLSDLRGKRRIHVVDILDDDEEPKRRKRCTEESVTRNGSHEPATSSPDEGEATGCSGPAVAHSVRDVAMYYGWTDGRFCCPRGSKNFRSHLLEFCSERLDLLGHYRCFPCLSPCIKNRQLHCRHFKNSEK
jgi:hypothetical protein